MLLYVDLFYDLAAASTLCFSQIIIKGQSVTCFLKGYVDKLTYWIKQQKIEIIIISAIETNIWSCYGENLLVVKSRNLRFKPYKNKPHKYYTNFTRNKQTSQESNKPHKNYTSFTRNIQTSQEICKPHNRYTNLTIDKQTRKEKKHQKKLTINKQTLQEINKPHKK